MPLRPSQVETLRLVSELPTQEIEADYLAEQYGIDFQAAWSLLRALAAEGYLKDSRLAGYRLTQLGREALGGSER